jgi:hypothetical protein
VPFHLCVIEALFEPGEDGRVQVPATRLPEAALAQAQEAAIRRRVLRGFTRCGWLDEADRKELELAQPTPEFQFDQTLSG